MGTPLSTLFAKWNGRTLTTGRLLEIFSKNIYSICASLRHSNNYFSRFLCCAVTWANMRNSEIVFHITLGTVRWLVLVPYFVILHYHIIITINHKWNNDLRISIKLRNKIEKILIANNKSCQNTYLNYLQDLGKREAKASWCQSR